MPVVIFIACAFTSELYVITSAVVNRTGGEQVPGFTWDFSGCTNLNDECFDGYMERFAKWRSKSLPVYHIEHLRLSCCWLISHKLLSNLAIIGCLDQLQA